MPYTPFLDRAIADKHAAMDTDGKRKKICYLAANVTQVYDDPEEQVRAEFWAELIYKYEYDPKSIGIEIPVPQRLPSERADLVVFEKNDNTRPFAIIECKRDGVSDAEFTQAIEQVYGNGTWQKFRAKYVMVVAGLTRRAFDMGDKYGALERSQNVLADLPRAYGKPSEYRFYYDRGGVLDIHAVPDFELTAAIQKCHQSLWGGGRLSPTGAFGELCKLIFVKINDEKKPRKLDQPYEFQIKTHEPEHKLAERIKALYEQHKLRDPEIFTETIRVPDATLALVVSHLESINLSATNLDVKGQAFQKFMDRFFKGDFGQFFTPRPLIEFAVGMMKPTAEDIVLDPACGSGGFLLQALDAVRAEAEAYYPDNDVSSFRHWHDFAQHNLFGIEINDEIARVAKMNMIIHDDGHTNVIGEDSLDRLNQIRLKTGNNGIAANQFTLILSNPPFGATISKEERSYLGDYDLGQIGEGQKRKVRNNQKTEILFLERIWQFLKPGTGRAAIVLPDGVLTNASLQYARDFLLAKYQLLAVVSFPQYAFAHFGAGVKASIIFVRKRADGEVPSDNEAIFMAAPETIGYDATGRETINSLPDIIKQYEAFQKDPAPFFV